MFVFVNPISSEDDELALTGRQGRQQTGGDTYTLEIAFPAVKYVQARYRSIAPDLSSIIAPSTITCLRLIQLMSNHPIQSITNALS